MKRKTVDFLLLLCMVFALSTACSTTSQTLEAKDFTAKTEVSKADSAESIAKMTLEDLKKTFSLTVETQGLSAEALYAEGQRYEAGNGVVQSYAKALAFYKAAQAAGSVNAVTAIAGLNALKEMVMSESPNGQGKVFNFFRTGVTAGQAGDYEKAFAIFYDDAFFFEDPVYRGLGSLGDLYKDGTGVKQDVGKAVTIYTWVAVVLGKGGGYTSLGHLYRAQSGTYPGIVQSNDKAVQYYLLSFKDEGLKETDFKGPRYAADYYDAGYKHDDGTSVAPDYVKAEEFYLIASKGNGRTFDGTACYKLGTYYEEGRKGVLPDFVKALEYYLKAISDKNVHATMLGIPQTYLALGRFYENGFSVEKNLATAISYYNKALDAAKENLALKDAAGNPEAQSVYNDATAGLKRLMAP